MEVSAPMKSEAIVANAPMLMEGNLVSLVRKVLEFPLLLSEIFNFKY